MYHKGALKDAMDDLNAAINRDSAQNPDPNYYFNRGNCHLAMQEPSAGLQDFREAVGIDPNSAKFRHSMGLAYQQMDGRDHHALEEFTQALEIDELHVPSLYVALFSLHQYSFFSC